jgi:hypothetical protein
MRARRFEETHMKIGIKLLFAAILSMSIGIACASPLLISELNLAPYPYLPEGPKPEVAVNVAYASFSVQPADPDLSVPEWYSGYRGNETPTTVNYNMVLNVTNLSDEDVTFDFLEASAAQNCTRGTSSLAADGVSTFGGSQRYVYLDGELINATWIPNSGNVPSAPHPDIPGQPPYPSSVPWIIESDATFPDEGYWREGVEISDTYVNGTLSYTYMYINGTWTDVTGRIEVPEREDVFSNILSSEHDIVSAWYNFQAPLPEGWDPGYETSTSTQDFGNGTTISTTITTKNPVIPPETNRTDNYGYYNSHRVTIYTGEGKFDSVWAPHESRLIMLSGTVFAYDADVVQYLQGGNIEISLMGQVRFTDTSSMINGTMTDTSVPILEIQQIQLHPDGDNFVYNGVLDAGQVFKPDQWDVEVFIDSGS